MFYIEEILYCLWREKCQPKAGNKDQFLQFHRYSSSAIKFPTTGLAHSSKSGSRNWSWLAGAPGETNSVIVLDILFPWPRAFGDQTLWFPQRTPCENQTRKDLRPNLFLTSKFDPQGLTVASRRIVAREKLDAPDSTKTSRRSPRSSAQISAKRVQFGLQSHFSCLLATPLDVKYTSWTFHLICMHYSRARVCKLCTIIHNFRRIEPRVSEPSQNPQLDKLALERGRWEDDRSSAGFHVFHSSGSVPSVCRQLECTVVQKIKINSLAGKRLNESSISVKYTVPN